MKKRKIRENKSIADLDDRHSTLVCFKNCKHIHAKNHREDAVHILETILSFSSLDRLQSKFPHPLKGDMKGVLSLDIKGRKNKYRLLVKREDGVNVIVDLCTDTH